MNRALVNNDGARFLFLDSKLKSAVPVRMQRFRVLDQTSSNFILNEKIYEERANEVRGGPHLLSLVRFHASNGSYAQGLLQAAHLRIFAQGRNEGNNNDAQNDRQQISVDIRDSVSQEIADAA